MVAVRHGRPVTAGAVVGGPTAGRPARRRRLGHAAQRRRLQQSVVGGQVERDGQRTRARGRVGAVVVVRPQQRRRHVKRGRVRGHATGTSVAAAAAAAEQLHLWPPLVAADVQHVKSRAQHVLHRGRGRRRGRGRVVRRRRRRRQQRPVHGRGRFALASARVERRTPTSDLPPLLSHVLVPQADVC